MKLTEWIRERKKRREAKKAESLARSLAEEAEETLPLDEREAPVPPEETEERRPLAEFKEPQTLEEADPDIDPAPSRFTEDYQAFLKRLEAEGENIRREVEEISRKEDEENSPKEDEEN